MPQNPCGSLVWGCEAMVGLALQQDVGLQPLGAGEAGLRQVKLAALSCPSVGAWLVSEHKDWK